MRMQECNSSTLTKAPPHNSAARLAMPFPPSAACKFLDLHPVNLRNLHLHLTKNPFASRPPHLCGVTLKNLRNKPSSMGVSAPKGSRGRSESPLSPPQRRFPLAAIKIKKHGSAMRRFPKGDRKALWSPPQRRFPLVAIKTKKHGSAMRRFPKGDRKALWSPPQRRFPLQQYKSSNIDKAKQFCSLLTAPLRCQSPH